MSRDILFPCRKRLDRRHGGWWNNLAKTHKPHCPKNQQLQQQQDDWRGRQSKKKACSSQKRSPTVVYRRDDHQDWGKGIKVNVVQSGASDCEKGFVNCFLRVLQAVGLYCSCRAAQARKDNFQKTFYQSFFHNLTHIYSARIVLPYKKPPLLIQMLIPASQSTVSEQLWAIKIALKIVLHFQMAMKNHERQSLHSKLTIIFEWSKKDGTGRRKARNVAVFLLNDFTARQKLNLPQKCSSISGILKVWFCFIVF